MSSFFRFMDTVGDGSGSSALKVDGSSTPVLFKMLGAAGVRTNIVRAIFYIRDGRTGFNASTFGAVAGLTNGLLFGVYDSDDALITDLLDNHPIKSNIEFSQFMYDTNIVAIGTGDSALEARWTFSKSGKPLTLMEGQYLGLTVRDDLTGLVDMCVSVQGNIANNR